jgi:hypothetical protein
MDRLAGNATKPRRQSLSEWKEELTERNREDDFSPLVIDSPILLELFSACGM